MLVVYLTILRREVNSYQPKPIQLKDIPGVNPEVVRKMDQLGIRNTKQLFPHVLTREDRGVFADPIDLILFKSSLRLECIIKKYK